MRTTPLVSSASARLLLCLFGVFFLLHAQGAESLDEVRKRIQDTIDIVKPLDVFGRVVDQQGEPVPGAEIRLTWTEARLTPIDPGHAEWVTADKDGEWHFLIKKPDTVAIMDLRRPGYEFARADNPHFSDVDRDRQIRNTTKDNRLVLVMRKKGQTTFLIEEKNFRMQVQPERAGMPIGFDFVQCCRIKDLARPVLNGQPLVCDLQMKATFNPAESKWSVVLAPGTPKGGILASDQLLYEAPEDGYQAEYAFVPEDQKVPKEKHLYLRGREPAIYTRIDLDYVSAPSMFLRLDGRSLTNPYGDRNLEQATDLPYEVKRRLTDEAVGALRAGKYPPKPDLQRLLREAATKAGKAKGEDEGEE